MNRLVSLTVHDLFCNINQRGECLKHIATPNPNASRKDSVMASNEDTPTGDFLQLLTAKNLPAAYDATDDQDGETLYYMLSALEVMRPSTMLGLAQIAGTQERFLELIRLADLAQAWPEKAEAFAGDAVDMFAPSESHAADNAYNLILRNVAIRADGEWQRISSVTSRLVQKMKVAK